MILMYVCFPLTWDFALSVCGSAHGKTCCAGSYWNDKKSTCEKCPVGYYSINCSDTCIFPSFGEDCQNTCKCAVNLCDHRFGCRDYNEGSIVHSATYSRNTTLPGNIAATVRPTKTASSENSTSISGLPYTILYIISAFVGIIVILCGLYVGTYFYKHCIRHFAVAEGNGKGDLHNAQVGYSSLGVDIQQQVEPSRDLTYLEPVSGQIAHYDEIKENDEINEFNIAKELETKECKDTELTTVPYIFPHSKSFPFPENANKNTIGHFKRTQFSTNSL